MSLPSSLLHAAESERKFTSTIWLTKVLSMEKDCTKSAGQKVKKVLFRRRKWPFSSSEKCYFRRNICGSFPGPVRSRVAWLSGIADLRPDKHKWELQACLSAQKSPTANQHIIRSPHILWYRNVDDPTKAVVRIFNFCVIEVLIPIPKP
jgi:hypothetical protein